MSEVNPIQKDTETLGENAFLGGDEEKYREAKENLSKQREKAIDTINSILTPDLRERLGFEGKIDPEEARYKTIDEAIAAMPYMVCVLALQEMKVDTGLGGVVLLKKGVEYVIAAPLYFAILTSTPAAKDVLIPAKTTFAKRLRRYNGEDLNGKSILVWRYGGLGDLMFIQPIIQYLRIKYPTAKICFATAKPNVELLKCWPSGLLNAVASQPFQASLLDNYDYHLTFEGTIERCDEAVNFNCYDIFQRVAGLNFDAREFPGKLVVNPFIRMKLKPFIPDNTVAIQLKSTSPIRTFPLAKTREFASALGEHGLRAGIVERRHYAFSIEDYFVDHGITQETAINLALHSKSIPYCLAIIDLCAGVIAVDSSLVHFGAALNKPTLGIYGPFPGDIRMRYYKTGGWIEPPECWNECGQRPCCFHQNEVLNCPSVPLGKPIACLDSMPVTDIIDKFVELKERVSAGV